MKSKGIYIESLPQYRTSGKKSTTNSPLRTKPEHIFPAATSTPCGKRKRSNSAAIGADIGCDKSASKYYKKEICSLDAVSKINLMFQQTKGEQFSWQDGREYQGTKVKADTANLADYLLRLTRGNK